MGLHRVTWDYTELQMATQYVGLHRFTWSYTGLQKATKYMVIANQGFIGLHMATQKSYT